MNNLKRIIVLNSLLVMLTQLLAQGPNNSGTYYKNADGKKGSELKTILSEIIRNHKELFYDNLWDCFRTTDVRNDGKVWDMYSGITNFTFGTDQAGNYKKEGDVYNREHSMPKSWFNDAEPMYTDLVHLVPTDGYVNGRRSNYPFGETDSPTYTSSGGFSKLGPSSVSGYTGIVFEPNDEYKGDFARIYFYMVTCYEENVSTWNSDMLAHNKYPALSGWALKMLLKWAAEDPVSQKEIDRNNAVYELQQNRNPYVDYPGLEQYVWGNNTADNFSYDNYVAPDIEPTPDPDPGQEPTDGEQIYRKVTLADELIAGYGYIIVCEEAGTALAESGNNIRNSATVDVSDNQVTTEVNKNGKPYQLILGTVNGAYTFYDATENVYLSLNNNGNNLGNSDNTATENAQWTINVNGGSTEISNKAYPERYINYNKTSPRFACYKTSSQQTTVCLYKNTVSTGIENINNGINEKIDVYNLAGQKIRSNVNADNALNGLTNGIYIINKKKYAVK
ncbi:endonuclease [uncultured Prevotella sp.]|uniref:endonuclease n=1 Tax=uncultured Prevotella sp. TaxID=159272 RepID=UPI002626DA3F|nr:endonuclease [uncultured Prevotella sp.]